MSNEYEPLLGSANSIKDLPNPVEMGAKQGVFVSIEAIDGAGKTSIIEHSIDKLKQDGITAVTFKNFTEGPLWKSVMKSKDQMLNDSQTWSTDFDRGIQVAVFLAHVRHELPFLLSNYPVVIADRFELSKIVYSRMSYHGNTGFSEQMITSANDIQVPSLTIILDLPAHEAVSRIDNRLNQGGRDKDWRENEHILGQASHWYKLLMKDPTYEERIVRIDATKSLDTVSRNSYEILQKHLVEKDIQIPR